LSLCARSRKKEFDQKERRHKRASFSLSLLSFFEGEPLSVPFFPFFFLCPLELNSARGKTEMRVSVVRRAAASVSAASVSSTRAAGAAAAAPVSRRASPSSRSYHGHAVSHPEFGASRDEFVATVVGSTGQVGRYVTGRLALAGAQVVLPYRGEEKGMKHLKPTREVGQIVPLGVPFEAFTPGHPDVAFLEKVRLPFLPPPVGFPFVCVFLWRGEKK
jgi:hypothetical protein